MSAPAPTTVQVLDGLTTTREHDQADRLAHQLTQVLGRIEAAITGPRTYCCTVCGCLCKRGESYPACALNTAEGTR